MHYSKVVNNDVKNSCEDPICIILFQEMLECWNAQSPFAMGNNNLYICDHKALCAKLGLLFKLL
jgi:hypothetical protein